MHLLTVCLQLLSIHIGWSEEASSGSKDRKRDGCLQSSIRGGDAVLYGRSSGTIAPDRGYLDAGHREGFWAGSLEGPRHLRSGTAFSLIISKQRNTNSIVNTCSFSVCKVVRIFLASTASKKYAVGRILTYLEDSRVAGIVSNPSSRPTAPIGETFQSLLMDGKETMQFQR